MGVFLCFLLFIWLVGLFCYGFFWLIFNCFVAFVVVVDDVDVGVFWGG